MTTSEIASPKVIPDPFAELGRKRRPWWILVVLVIAALGAGGFVYFRTHRAPPAPRYLTARVTTGDVVESIEATGTVQPLVQVQVGSQVSGRISRLLVDYNSRVHSGDLLAEIDQQPFRARVAEVRAALSSAQAAYARAQADLQLQERVLARATDMRTRGLNAPAEVDAARGARDASRAQIGIAQAAIAQARATLESATTNMNYTRILAPIDGIVITRSIDVGQTVAASFTAPVLFVIANDLTHMRIIADIDEADIGKLSAGLGVDARVDAFQGENFHGTVHELRFGPTTTAGVVTYPAVIDVANPETKLRPGMTATITVTTSRHEGVMRVPNAALRFRPNSARSSEGGAGGGRGAGGGGGGGAGAGGPGGRGGAPGAPGAPRSARLFVLRGTEAVPIRVRTGVSDGIFTEVEAAELHPGVEVVIDETDEAAGSTPAGRPAGSSGGGRGGGGGGPRRVL